MKLFGMKKKEKHVHPLVKGLKEKYDSGSKPKKETYAVIDNLVDQGFIADRVMSKGITEDHVKEMIKNHDNNDDSKAYKMLDHFQSRIPDVEKEYAKLSYSELMKKNDDRYPEDLVNEILELARSPIDPDSDDEDMSDITEWPFRQVYSRVDDQVYYRKIIAPLNKSLNSGKIGDHLRKLYEEIIRKA